jgi:hypothetical protein
MASNVVPAAMTPASMPERIYRPPELMPSVPHATRVRALAESAAANLPTLIGLACVPGYEPGHLARGQPAGLFACLVATQPVADNVKPVRTISAHRLMSFQPVLVGFPTSVAADIGSAAHVPV